MFRTHITQDSRCICYSRWSWRKYPPLQHTCTKPHMWHTHIMQDSRCICYHGHSWRKYPPLQRIEYSIHGTGQRRCCCIMYVYMCVCVCIYICIYICMDIYRCICAYLCIYVYIYIYIYIHEASYLQCSDWLVSGTALGRDLFMYVCMYVYNHILKEYTHIHALTMLWLISLRHSRRSRSRMKYDRHVQMCSTAISSSIMKRPPTWASNGWSKCGRQLSDGLWQTEHPVEGFCRRYVLCEYGVFVMCVCVCVCVQWLLETALTPRREVLQALSPL
jgi:hypothetical protein